MPEPRPLSVVIVGAGFGGIAAAIELSRHGFEDITVLERASELGGTWHYNRYPGCACDVPSHLYSFSYAQRRDWSRLCSPQEEILEYLKGVARDRAVDRRVITGVEVVACEFSEAEARWTVRAADGRSWTADAVILATGQLHRPAIPHLPGQDQFTGRSFHSARWDHGHDLRGRRVAVIGTGASAVQLVPEVAVQAARLYVFQRTGNWFLPRRNRPYPRALRALFERVPLLQKLRRWLIYQHTESLTVMIRHPRTLGRIGALWSTLFMRMQLRDRQVREKVWPHYTFGCKRILFSSYFLPALQQPNVELINDPVAGFEKDAVLTADGTHREVDTVIYATGFRTTRFMFPMEVRGAGGRTLAEAWRDGPHAHLGLAVPGFPSLFMVYGPNTNTSGGSIIEYEEAQASYIRQALEYLRRTGAAGLQVRPEVEAAMDREVQERFRGTAWLECDSWYRNESGRIVTNWPGYMREYVRRVREFDPAEYELLPVAAPEPLAA